MIDIIPIIVIIFVVLIVLWVLSLRRIVPPRYADVVTRRGSVQIYSADKSVTSKDFKPTEKPDTVYYEFPSRFPGIGILVKRMPLTIIEIPVMNYKTFAKGNARFVVDVSVYCRITDVLEAAQKFPGETLEDFKKGIREIIVSAIRKTTAGFAVEDVISKRQEIAADIAADIKDDFKKWGVELTNVAVVDIRDPYREDKNGAPIVDSKTGEPVLETTVIRDISNKKEAEINSLSRQEIATKKKEALVAEATNLQISELRRLEAEEAIGKRDQEKQQAVFIKQQEAVLKEMEVKRTRDVTSAEIEANASVKKAEGERKAAIERAEGQKQKLALEGEGDGAARKAVGFAEADVIRAKKVAEADGLMKYAEAQAKQQEKAKEIRVIEMQQVVYSALAEALRGADIRYIGSGEPTKFLDFFTPKGGLNIGGALGSISSGLQAVTPSGEKKSAEDIVRNVAESPKVKEILDAVGITPDDILGKKTESPPTPSNGEKKPDERSAFKTKDSSSFKM